MEKCLGGLCSAVRMAELLMMIVNFEFSAMKCFSFTACKRPSLSSRTTAIAVIADMSIADDQHSGHKLIMAAAPQTRVDILPSRVKGWIFI